MKRILCLLTLGTALSAAASGDGFTPYQTIIDRMPFGRPGASAAPLTSADGAGVDGGDAAAALDPEREKDVERIRASVRVCAVNAPPGAEPVVGFTDLSQNPPKHYLLAQGQSKDGWTVLLVDAPERHAVLSRDGLSVSLYLGLPQRTEVGKAKLAKNAKRTKRANHSKRPKHPFRNPPPEGGKFLVYCGCFRVAGSS